jgi:hypothetical protein
MHEKDPQAHKKLYHHSLLPRVLPGCWFIFYQWEGLAGYILITYTINEKENHNHSPTHNRGKS